MLDRLIRNRPHHLALFWFWLDVSLVANLYVGYVLLVGGMRNICLASFSLAAAQLLVSYLLYRQFVKLYARSDSYLSPRAWLWSLAFDKMERT